MWKLRVCLLTFLKIVIKNKGLFEIGLENNFVFFRTKDRFLKKHVWANFYDKTVFLEFVPKTN